MAARYADAANIVAQGQSFYTGLLPGSYEKAGAGGGSNVMGKGSGGSAGVSADRTSSTAAQQSITGYPTGGSILGKQPMSDNDLLEQIAKNTALPNPDPTQKGGDPAADDGGPGLPERFGGDDPEAAEALMPQAERLKWAAAGLPNPPNAPGQQNPFGRDTLTAGKGMGALIPGAPAKSKSPRTRTPEQQAARTAKAREDRETVNKANAMGGIDTLVPAADLKFGMEEVTKSKGPTDYIKDSTMGQWSGSVQRRASTRAQTRQPGVQQSIPQQAIPSLSVSGAASTRSHTRQSGVQQSATHKSFLYPNMANSTNRALNF
jgi:hypothetical protein